MRPENIALTSRLSNVKVILSLNPSERLKKDVYLWPSSGSVRAASRVINYMTMTNNIRRLGAYRQAQSTELMLPNRRQFFSKNFISRPTETKRDR